MNINWNIIDRTGQDHAAIAATLRPKIAKLERLLAHFPEDAVHLQVILDSCKGDPSFEVVFNLRVPSDVLHVSRQSPSLVAALDDGIQALVRRLKRLQARYRKDYAWKHRCAQKLPERPVAFAGAPLPERQGPQTQADAVAEILKEDYRRLLGFVSRQINEHVRSGTIAIGVLDPQDIVDRVAEKVLRHPARKPDSMDYRTWCSSLAFQETRQAIRRHAEEARISVPIDLDLPPEPSPAGEDDLEPEAFALNLLQSQLEPDEATLADVIADPHIESPDREVSRLDIVNTLRDVSRHWPKTDREVFQLHVLEGLSINDIAHTFGSEPADIETVVARVRAQLRTLLSDLTGHDSPVEPSSAQTESYVAHVNRVAAERGTA